MRNRVALTVVAAVLLLAPFAGQAEPPLERILVTAVADADQERVLVRWRTLEGIKRYDHYDVLRRDADSDVFLKLNDLPIGPLTDVASIETLFTTPGYEDSLAWIQETLGAAYATGLLNLAGSNPPREAAMKLTFLPDQNYGAALALGMGWMDDTVTFGETYVYEVWGVDHLGYAVERLGRASAEAGSPGALSAVTGMDCTEPGDQRADMAAFLRWDPAVDENRYLFGYEVFRRECDVLDACPADMSPGHPETVKANQFPVLAASPGAVREGGVLYQANCTSCHATRSVLKGKTLEGFRKRQHSDVNAPGFAFSHDTIGLNALSADSLKKIFDYIHEFRFRDDGDDTVDDPLQEGCYCYQVVPRDLLGQLGSPSSGRECEVKDLIPPEVPAQIKSERVLFGGAEVCEISWQRNDDLNDGTVQYDIFRVGNDLPRDAYFDESLLYTSLPQPGGVPGDTVAWTDTTQNSADATHRFYYAVRAKDASGNVSPTSGWVPCVPRDIEPPSKPNLVDVLCCEGAPDACTDHRSMEDPWIAQGGGKVVVANPEFCQPRYVYELPSDGFRVRVLRSFDNVNWYPSKDIVPEPCTPPQTGFCFSPSFVPSLSQKIWYKFKTFDTSGNMSDASNAMGAVALSSLKPPAPQIFEVFGSPQPAMPGRVIIRFRSLKPSALLGFALYTRPLPPVVPNNWKQLISIAKGDLIQEFPAINFAGTMPSNPDQWVVVLGAETLDTVEGLNNTDPEHLYYNSEEGGYEDTYQMAVDIGNAEMVNLQLAAIGWSGHEGPHGTKAWDGWVTGDDHLEWPKFRRDVLIDLTNPPDTSLSATRVGHHMRLEWSADPIGCYDLDDDVPLPFVVFRRRENSPNWQQISPPFMCPPGDPVPPVTYEDYDVEERTWYRYLVIQFDEKGEFTWRRESDTVCHYSSDFCESPEPQ